MTPQTDRTRDQVERLHQALRAHPDGPIVAALIGELHPADLAEVIGGLDEAERVTFFRLLPAAVRAETLSEVADELWPELLASVGESDVQALIAALDSDVAADILADMPRDEARQILDRIEPRESREIAALMRYDEESAGGVMTTDLVSVPGECSADEAIVRIREQGREIQTFYTVYVVDGGGRLLGTLGLQDLILADGGTRVAEIMDPDIVRVHPTEDQEAVARLIAKYNLVSIPVVDEFDRLLGRITVDDVIDIIESETTEDIFRQSGVHSAEESYGSPAEIIRSRTPWLLITLGTSGLGALVVAQFEETIQRLAFIAVFMPVVAAMAGNSAIQATTVAVRRLAISGRSDRPWRSLPRELAAGLVIGGLIAVLLGLVAGFWQQRVIVALVVGGSMWAAMSLGVLWGAAFPILLDRLGLDPAVSSSVFLTTLTDFVSFLLILGSATFFLGRWL